MKDVNGGQISSRQMLRHFDQCDPVISAAMRRIGPFALKRNRNYFQTLCRSIISQQISTLAAETIHGRFRRLFPSLRPNPARVLALAEESLRDAGLSRQKISYLKDLSEHFHSGAIRPRRLICESDEAIIEQLTAVKGIGRWTAEMFLIFSLNRYDVLPVDDLGVQKGVQRLYALPQMPSRAELRSLGERWRPLRTVAAWYAWRSLDSENITY
ncbi:MAG: DNA-3-methyladenine glycosylase 2 family protein [Candidatus Nitrohelix vancouverensis]|uniref:DNA-3-methyladenine glycosylase II n=1 Tax=Candidatus Nitrohelix vancouverensis TaxID=2705534 RepID=A0A7T0BZN6_9BACT|nr:MAG: DNA-3-methyladenine glycosylase 2 family protein [Candidatus Nitrohelix vancouverensis]